MDDRAFPLTDHVTFSAAEIAGIEEARRQAEGGLVVDFADVEAWLDSLDTDTPLPRPEPRRKS